MGRQEGGDRVYVVPNTRSVSRRGLVVVVGGEEGRDRVCVAPNVCSAS